MYSPCKICIQLSVGTMGQYEQICKPKYNVYFQTYTLKIEVVKNHLGLKEDQEMYRDIL